jgi:antitoxin component YwqK of YwqJK toxin-antitoxin module
MKVLSNARNEVEDESGILYDLHEKMREILTNYNDTVEGRCAVCLENFTTEGEAEENKNFTERVDLVRIDKCFHRFHMICVHRDWFMPR